jgi:large subunit ribosomal protein L20
MPRATNKPASRQKKKKVLKRAKGYRQGRSKLIKRAREFTEKGLSYAFAGRKQRKRDFRRLWTVRLSAACKANGLSYSKFIDGLKRLDIKVNRKMLSEIAFNMPEHFSQIATKVKEILGIRGAAI